MDSFDKKTRSRVMRAVKSSKNKSTEIKFLEFLKYYKISGWRRNYKLAGKPDFAFPKQKLLIFTDGCFWHGHNCRNTKPKSNAIYWKKKIAKNKIRDIKVSRILKSQGWTVMRIWECNLNRSKWDSLSVKMSEKINPT